MDRHHYNELESLHLNASQALAPERHAAARQSTLVSVCVNLVLATAQVIVGWFSHSQSLISDGFHSLSDLLADFVVLVANKISRQHADADHPYGHARFETVASMILGVLLMVAAGGMLWMAAHKFLHPETIVKVHAIALFTALLTIVCKETLFRYMLRVAHRVNSTMLVANAWHARSDAVSSLVVALGITGNLLGYTFLDPLAAAIVGILIGRTGAQFSWKALSQLMDSGLSPEETEKIRQTLLATPGVRDVHDLRTRFMGDDVLIDVHLIVDERLSASEAHHIGDAAREQVRHNHHVLDMLVHIDPEDDYDSEDALKLYPSRDEVIAMIYEAVDTLKPELTLHYLTSGLDIDLVLAHDLTPDEQLLLNNAIAHLQTQVPQLRKVRVLTVQQQLDRTLPDTPQTTHQ